MKVEEEFKQELDNIKLAIIGLGYVGLPLAIEFAKKRRVIGFDTSLPRIEQLKEGFDKTLEISKEELIKTENLSFTSNIKDISHVNTYIVTVPTPINADKSPDLNPLFKASESLGKLLNKGDLVIYESTVYPGMTEEECVPILERASGLKFNKEFFVGYSPERINPGDKEHRLNSIVKVTSGSTEEIAELVDSLYKEIITAGTYKADSIIVAEAAKVIENTQRDLNIAFVNELAIIFNKMGIDTETVLKTAATKWNFLDFKPGIVGGHCIGVDPYYLTYKAKSLGYNPEIILAGRKLNDSMGIFISEKMSQAMKNKGIEIKGSNVLVAGLSFKENCNDLRNSRVVDIISQLKNLNIEVDIYDPWVDQSEAESEYNLKLIESPKTDNYEGIIVAVAHDKFKNAGSHFFHDLGKQNHVLFDLKGIFSLDESDLRL